MYPAFLHKTQSRAMGNTEDLSLRLNVLSTMSKSMADTSNILTNGVIFSTPKHTDPHTVRGRSTQKDGVCNEHIFRNGSFRKLKMAEESNDLTDLAKVVPESYQKSNELSVNRKNRQNVAIDDRTFTDRDKVRHIQSLGNDN